MNAFINTPAARYSPVVFNASSMLIRLRQSLKIRGPKLKLDFSHLQINFVFFLQASRCLDWRVTRKMFL